MGNEEFVIVSKKKIESIVAGVVFEDGEVAIKITGNRFKCLVTAEEMVSTMIAETSNNEEVTSMMLKTCFSHLREMVEEKQTGEIAYEEEGEK